MNKIIEYFKDLFYEEYEVTIWFKVKTSQFETESTKKVFHFKSIQKKTQTHFVGIDKSGEVVEIKTTEPFDFQIKKVH